MDLVQRVLECSWLHCPCRREWVGKSSTLVMLAGQVSPDSGTLTMYVSGESMSEATWARRWPGCPVVFSPTTSQPGARLQFHGAFRQSRPGQLGWGPLLDASGLSVADNVPMNRWSSGQRQRLKLMLAIGTEADVVLLDEPTSNLDAHGIAWFHRVLEDIQRESTAVVATMIQREAPQAMSTLEIGKQTLRLAAV